MSVRQVAYVTLNYMYYALLFSHVIAVVIHVTTTTTGMGLGLYISNTISHLHLINPV